MFKAIFRPNIGQQTPPVVSRHRTLHAAITAMRCGYACERILPIAIYDEGERLLYMPRGHAGSEYEEARYKENERVAQEVLGLPVKAALLFKLYPFKS